MGVTLDGVTFRWDEQEGLVISTSTDRRVLSGASGAQLLDFLQSIQEQIYTAEHHGDLPAWVRPQLEQYVQGGIVIEEEQQLTQIGPGRLLLPSRTVENQEERARHEQR